MLEKRLFSLLLRTGSLQLSDSWVGPYDHTQTLTMDSEQKKAVSILQSYCIQFHPHWPAYTRGSLPRAANSFLAIHQVYHISQVHLPIDLPLFYQEPTLEAASHNLPDSWIVHGQGAM